VKIFSFYHEKSRKKNVSLILLVWLGTNTWMLLVNTIGIIAGIVLGKKYNEGSGGDRHLIDQEGDTPLRIAKRSKKKDPTKF
jgi:hypothetical protein